MKTCDGRILRIDLSKRGFVNQIGSTLAVWNSLLDCHYDQHGWNRETGWPTERTPATLELEVVAERLREAGHIAIPLKDTRK